MNSEAILSAHIQSMVEKNLWKIFSRERNAIINITMKVMIFNLSELQQSGFSITEDKIED